MKSNLRWYIMADQPHNPSNGQWDAYVVADMKVNGWHTRPTKKSALRLAQKLADESSHNMEVFWKQGKRAWKYGLLVKPNE